MRRIFVCIIVALCLPIRVWAADFNPNFLITDDDLQDATSMSRADIQAFLNDRGGYIAQYSTTDVSSTIRMAADIIYQSAIRYSINPKYLLVKLQKEQSLVTDPNPTQKQLDWATGYSVCDSCSTDDPKIQKNKGFGMQVDSAAGIMRWYYDHVNEFDWIKRPGNIYTIDNQAVTPATLATGFLYTYTPHLHGNQNFWTLWQKWFAQVYPSGTLVKTVDDPTVYLITNGEKRAFQNMTALLTRFDPRMILTTTASELSEYPLGAPIALPNYAVLFDGTTHYLVDNDTIRPFDSETTVRYFGYNPDEIISVTTSDLNGYTQGTTITKDTSAPIGSVVRIKETNGLYYIKDGAYHPIRHEAIYKTNFSNLPITTTSIASLQTLTNGDPILFKDGTLFGITGFNEIYVVENGQKRHIANENVFNGLGYRWNTIVWVDEITGTAHPTGEPLYTERTTTPSQLNTTTPRVEVTSAPTIPSIATGTMYRTSPEELTTVGPEFSTPIDAYIVADAKTGTILTGKNIDSVRPLASLTKVMTAYRLLKEGLNVHHTTTYNAKKHDSLYGNYRIANGEVVNNSDLLDALLVSSVNTPAHMLVDTVSKDSVSFVSRMNREAQTMGLSKTRFTDPSGEDLGNVGTAREYLTLFTQISDLAELQPYLSKISYEYDEVLDRDGKPHHYDSNTNELMSKKNLPYTILSSKTGYLDEAGSNLAMKIKRNGDGKEFIMITLGNPDIRQRFQAPDALIRWAINTF